MRVVQLKLELWSLQMVDMESEEALEELQVLLYWKSSLSLRNTLSHNLVYLYSQTKLLTHSYGLDVSMVLRGLFTILILIFYQLTRIVHTPQSVST